MFTVTPEGRENPFNLYLGLMEEIKIRLSAIHAMTEGGWTPAAITRDSCFLQLRMVCEAIAVGCLVAHGKNVGTLSRKLEKHWSAEKIMDDLEKLNPAFFPIAVNFFREPEMLRTEDIKPAPLTKAELLTLYGKCGDALHRGNLDKLREQPVDLPPISFDEIFNATCSIRRLLQIHRMGSGALQRGFICSVENTPGGRASMLEYGGSSG